MNRPQTISCEQLHFPEVIRSHHMLSAQPFNSVYHMHDSCELLLFLNGSGDYYIEHRLYPISRGTLLLIGSNEMHRAAIQGASPYERIATHFYPNFIRRFSTPDCDLLACFKKRPGARQEILALNPQELEYYLSLADRMHTALAADHFGHDILAATYLLQMLVFVNTCLLSRGEAPKKKPSSPALPLSSQIMAYVNRHLNEPVTVLELAEYVHLDPSYLCRKFKEQAGCSLREYIILKRVALAKELLRQGKTVTEACQGSGFSDYSNFIRTFKKYAGMPPGKFRQNQALP